MTKPAIYKGTLTAYITYDTTLTDVKDHPNPVASFEFTTINMDGMPNWTRAGTAEITVTMLPDKEVLSGQVESLDKEIAKARATAEAHINTLLDRRNKLLAIDYRDETL